MVDRYRNYRYLLKGIYYNPKDDDEEIHCEALIEKLWAEIDRLRAILNDDLK
jgi:hypothetical protein